MALAVTALAGSFSNTNASSYATASVSPAANSLLVVCAGAAGVPETVPTFSHADVASWSSPTHHANSGTGSNDRGAAIGYGIVDSSVIGGTVTIDYGAAAMTAAIWSVFYVTGYDTADPVQEANQQETAAATGTSAALTFGALVNASSMVVAFLAKRGAEAITVGGTGWTTVHDETALAATAPAITGRSIYKINDTGPSMSWVTTINHALVGIEVRAAAGAPPTVVPMLSLLGVGT